MIKRRHLLQFAAASLTALGWNQLTLKRLGDRYGRVLAQPTSRKLALLVGINQYPESGLIPPLYGCLNDVELQYHLLVHRFGFNPQNILKVTDAQATRTGILQAFEEHLIKQARPDDVVVFHYSGHGSRVLDPDRDHADGLNSTLVPVDAVLPPGFPQQGGIVADITGHTLFLLMAALPTDQVTFVLDSCHAGGGTRGNLRVRSRSGGAQLEMSEAERAYQAQWLTRLNLSPADFIARRRQGIAQGAAIAAAKRDQLAADAPFEDFFAGAFTYTLTQYLWQQPTDEAFVSAIANVARTTTRLSLSEQEPQLEMLLTANRQAPVYFLAKQTPPAEAVITKVEGTQAEVWLGGLEPNSLAAFQQAAVLSAVNLAGESQGLVQIVSRQGLVAEARLLQAIAPGSLLQEQARSIPATVALRIGLHESLGDQLADVRTALQGLSRIQPMALQQQAVDYILARFSPDLAQASGGGFASGSLGLFSPAMVPIPGSFGAADETATAAVERLQAKLRSLLAARLVKLTLNTHTSRLDIAVTMTPVNQSQPFVTQAMTVRGGGAVAPQPSITQLPLETAIEFFIHNREPQDLYLSVLVIDATGEITVIFPNQWTTLAAVTRLRAGEIMRLPDPSRDSFQIVTQPPLGATEVLMIASTNPLDEALRALRNLAAQSSQSRGPVALSEPTAVIDSLLNDLSGKTRGRPSELPSNNLLDTRQLAALSITFEVV
ncbi:caspase family protein [Almyronema epifaneia]